MARVIGAANRIFITGKIIDGTHEQVDVLKGHDPPRRIVPQKTAKRTRASAPEGYFQFR
jgi:hypothetical protein